MQEFLLEDLAEDSGKQEKAVSYFAASDLPNGFFLQQFHAPCPAPFCEKKYWEGFAKTLVLRGLPRIADVKSDILRWWQDANWAGFSVMQSFVLAHAREFTEEVKTTIRTAYAQKDIGWFKWLLVLYEQMHGEFRGTIDSMLEYLDDDSWKDFATVFGCDLLRIVL